MSNALPQIILPVAEPSPPLAVRSETPRKSPKRTKEHAAQFAVERLKPCDDGGTDLLLIHRDYGRWCAEKGQDALSAAQIASALSQLFASAGICVDERDGRFVAVGVGLKDHQDSVALIGASGFGAGSGSD